MPDGVKNPNRLVSFGPGTPPLPIHDGPGSPVERWNGGTVERNRRSHVFLGSANATDAAWGGYDELLVEIVGKTGTFGVSATLGAAGGGTGTGGFGQILLPYTLGDGVVRQTFTCIVLIPRQSA